MPRWPEGHLKNQWTPEANALAEAAVPLAVFMAQKWWNRCGGNLNDWFSEASYALFYAGMKFDPSKGIPFSAFAGLVINHRLGRFSRVNRKRQKRDTQLSVLVNQKQDDDFAVDNSVPSPSARLERQEEIAEADETVKKLLRCLPPRERELLIRWKCKGERQQDIATSWNVTKSRVQQLAKRAIRKLRKAAGVN